MTTSKTITTHNLDETRQLGLQLAAGLAAGDFVALSGELGSGKTSLTQGICAGLNVTDTVNSPTFTLINIYRGSLPVYHFDLYRLGDISELDGLGYEEYFWGAGVTLVEWADRAPDYFPAERIEIRLEHAGGDRRRIAIALYGQYLPNRLQPHLDLIYAHFSA